MIDCLTSSNERTIGQSASTTPLPRRSLSTLVCAAREREKASVRAMIPGRDVLREARARFHPVPYLSEWTSGLALGAGILAPAAHVFFLSLFPALAFSAQMEAGTGGAVAGVQVLMSTAIFGLVQAVFGAVSFGRFLLYSRRSRSRWKKKTQKRNSLLLSLSLSISFSTGEPAHRRRRRAPRAHLHVPPPLRDRAIAKAAGERRIRVLPRRAFLALG